MALWCQRFLKFVACCGSQTRAPLLALGFSLVAGSVMGEANAFPQLQGPHGNWGDVLEEHGWEVLICAVVVLGAGLLLWALLRRPAPVVVPAPESVARRALAALRDRPEEAALVGEVSRIFRRYLQFAFALPPEELTTTELARALQTHAQGNSLLAGSIGDFLRRCDEWKFAPDARGTKLAAVAGASELLEQIELHGCAWHSRRGAGGGSRRSARIR